MKRPNFFIIGAPKCGTTSLAHWLAQHPRIFMSPVKEPHFHNTDMNNRSYRSKPAYEALFKGASEQHMAVGEASTWYLYSRDAVPNILRDDPSARLIVCLRNPVEMAVSLHNQALKRFAEHLERFEDAWNAQADRREGRNISSYCREPAALVYGQACALGSQLQRLFGIAPRENVKLVFLEDMRADPRAVYLDILAFLGLPDDGRHDFSARNQASKWRSARAQKALWSVGQIKERLGIPRLNLGVIDSIASLNTRRKAANQWDSSFIEREVRPFFAAEIELIEGITGRSMAHWVD